MGYVSSCSCRLSTVLLDNMERVSETPFFDELHFEDEMKLLEYLRLSNQVWGSARASEWIFRGQWDASWHLMPRAWRAHDFSKSVKLATYNPEHFDHTVLKSIYDDLKVYYQGVFDFPEFNDEIENRTKIIFFINQSEINACVKFADLCDEVGLPYFEEEIRFTMLSKLKRMWYEYSPYKLFALAQHHGIPTRLLDWTRNPLVAAFFSCNPDGRDDSESGNLAIWAIRHDYPVKKVENKKVNLILYATSTFGSKYLLAQKGLFTWVSNFEAATITSGASLSHDFVALKLASDLDLQECILRKITLPKERADALYMLLYREGITKVHLMPSYDVAAQTALEIGEVNNRTK